MSIYFRYRKSQRTLNASFFLWDGDKLGDTSGWLVGDTVSVMFDIPKEQAELINQNFSYESGVKVSVSGFGETATVHVQCNVVSRRHAIAWRQVGRFSDIGSSITLEAINGEWEDVLCWVVLGEKPTWIEEKETTPPNPQQPDRGSE